TTRATALCIDFSWLQTMASRFCVTARLFYWCLFCAVSIKMYYFGWLLHIPFYVISFFVDIYYETQLVVIAYLVYPKTLGIQRLQELAEANSKAFLETAKENLKCGAKLAYDWSLEFTTARS
ncbi:unnamed protein product, partial [Effrenium voratum]